MTPGVNISQDWDQVDTIDLQWNRGAFSEVKCIYFSSKYICPSQNSIYTYIAN